MKDKTKLFKKIPAQVYEQAARRLQTMRYNFPSYRDDQLLMFIICNDTLLNRARKARTQKAKP